MTHRRSLSDENCTYGTAGALTPTYSIYVVPGGPIVLCIRNICAVCVPVDNNSLQSIATSKTCYTASAGQPSYVYYYSFLVLLQTISTIPSTFGCVVFITITLSIAKPVCIINIAAWILTVLQYRHSTSCYVWSPSFMPGSPLPRPPYPSYTKHTLFSRLSKPYLEKTSLW